METQTIAEILRECVQPYLKGQIALCAQFRDETGQRCKVTRIVEYTDKWYIQWEYMDKPYFSGEYLNK